MDDDEKWIKERLDNLDVSHGDDLRAALARGREQGRAEGASERLMELDGIYQTLERAGHDFGRGEKDDALTAVGVVIADRDKLREDVRREREYASQFSADSFRAILARAENAEADRDRLAKRCEELEADVTRERECAQESADIMRRARDRADSLSSRLAAQESRLTALVEALHSYHKPDAPFGNYPELMARLATLRARVGRGRK